MENRKFTTNYENRTVPEIRRLTDFPQVEILYKSRLKQDFARNELKPLSSMRRLWEKGAYDCYGLFDGDELLGYAFLVRLGKNCLLDYFAIADGCRNRGFGSVFLRRLTACLSDTDCTIVEVEDPDKAPEEAARVLRERRLQFYLRCGYLKTDLTSVVFGADYRILEAPAAAPHTAEELRSVYTELYRNIFPPLFFRTQFRASSELAEKS